MVLVPKKYFRHSDGVSELHWQLKSVAIPLELQNQRDAILRDLSEALQAYSFGLDARDDDIIKLFY